MDTTGPASPSHKGLPLPEPEPEPEPMSWFLALLSPLLVLSDKSIKF